MAIEVEGQLAPGDRDCGRGRCRGHDDHRDNCDANPQTGYWKAPSSEMHTENGAFSAVWVWLAKHLTSRNILL